MQRVKLDSAAPDVKDFICKLAENSNGVELELAGRVIGRFIRPQQLFESQRQELLDKVTRQLERSHARNRRKPAKVIERVVRTAVDKVRRRKPE